MKYLDKDKAVQEAATKIAMDVLDTIDFVIIVEELSNPVYLQRLQQALSIPYVYYVI